MRSRTIKEKENGMFSSVVSALIGYLLGGLSPAALIAALKKKELRASGTRNLGATNVTISLGFRYGVVVMALDIVKAYLSVKLAKAIFPQAPLAGVLAGCGAVVGHIFPVYMKFKGGKGLASLGGLILALDPVSFLILLAIALTAIAITNYAVSATFTAASLTPLVLALRLNSFAAFFILLIVGGLIIFKHLENLERIKNGSEKKLTAFLRERSRRGN